MKFLHGIIIFVVAFLLTPVLGNLIPIFGNHLDVVLCLLVMLVFMYDDPTVPFICAAIVGILYDMAYGMYTGPTTITLTLTGLIVLALKQLINKEVFFNSVIMMLVCTFAYKLIYWGVYYILGSPYTLGYALGYIPWNLLFNSIFALVLFFILSKKTVKHRQNKYQV